MVGATDSRPHPIHAARQVPKLNVIRELPEQRQQGCWPTYLSPTTFTSPKQISLPVFAVPSTSSFGTEKENVDGKTNTFFPPILQTSIRTQELCMKENHLTFPSELGHVTLVSSDDRKFQQGFLTFGPSGNQTTVIYGSIGHPAQVPTSGFCEKERPAGNLDSMDYLFRKAHCENHVAGEENEMHEDTDKMNALLYSDDDVYSNDDEVTSICHSPAPIKGNDEKLDQVWQLTEKIGSSDGPRKRRRLLHVEYTRSSRETADSDEGNGSKKDSNGIAESRRQKLRDEEHSFLGDKPSGKDEILEVVRVLESIVPGPSAKDPVKGH